MGVRTKGSGKTGKDTVWGSRREEDGFIGENGRKGSKGGTAFDSPTRPQRNTKERGQMDCKTVMVRKHTQMMVSTQNIN